MANPTTNTLNPKLPFSVANAPPCKGVLADPLNLTRAKSAKLPAVGDKVFDMPKPARFSGVDPRFVLAELTSMEAAIQAAVEVPHGGSVCDFCVPGRLTAAAASKPGFFDRVDACIHAYTCRI